MISQQLEKQLKWPHIQAIFTAVFVIAMIRRLLGGWISTQITGSCGTKPLYDVKQRHTRMLALQWNKANSLSEMVCTGHHSGSYHIRIQCVSWWSMPCTVFSKESLVSMSVTSSALPLLLPMLLMYSLLPLCTSSNPLILLQITCQLER